MPLGLVSFEGPPLAYDFNHHFLSHLGQRVDWTEFELWRYYIGIPHEQKAQTTACNGIARIYLRLFFAS
jgi:hypothetical protein